MIAYLWVSAMVYGTMMGAVKALIAPTARLIQCSKNGRVMALRAPLTREQNSHQLAD